MGFFRRDKPEEKKKPKQIIVEDQEERLEEQVAELGDKDDSRRLEQVQAEVESEIKRAAELGVREIHFLSEGRCPRCAKQIEAFLFTAVCRHCGWSTYITPEKGTVVVHLKTGSTVSCQRVFPIDGGDLLCLTGKVASHRIPAENIDYVEYQWPPDEIAGKRKELERESSRFCHWCEREFDRDNPDRRVTYVAFGRYQERYGFCSEKCFESFRRQFPTRIHRNCYEVNCVECELCEKRYEVADKAVPGAQPAD